MRVIPPPVRRRSGALAACLALAVVAVTVGPSPSSSLDPGPQTRIVGGSVAPDGAWPSQAGVLDASVADDHQALFCGGTVIDPSWILTAAHCVTDVFDGTVDPPSSMDVLTGRQDLDAVGGQRLHVAGVNRFPFYVTAYTQNDVALLRLDYPTNSPAMAIAQPGQEALWAPGVDAVAVGWGTTSEGGSSLPAKLRQVTLPIQSNPVCAADYPSLPYKYVADSMLCAGPTAGGKDTCQGDSGGPLMVADEAKTGWLVAGITSFGDGCARPNAPGVYTRVATFSNWVGNTIRFGPFANADEFVVWNWYDFTGRWPGAADLSSWRNVLVPGADLDALPESLVHQADTQATIAAVARLYQAYFLRLPDTIGQRHWVDALHAGYPLAFVSDQFAASAEFAARYGTLTNRQFVEQIYQNVLQRTGDTEGVDYWTSILDRGVATRGGVMSFFSESAENRATTAGRIDRVTLYFAMLRQVPTEAWLTDNAGTPLRTISNGIRLSLPYIRRV